MAISRISLHQWIDEMDKQDIAPPITHEVVDKTPDGKLVELKAELEKYEKYLQFSRDERIKY